MEGMRQCVKDGSGIIFVGKSQKLKDQFDGI
jgi:hypothetical protein